MKKTLLLCLLTLFALWSFADNNVTKINVNKTKVNKTGVNKNSVVDSSDNVLSVKVLKTKDLKRIPVEVSLNNPTVPLTCVQCFLQLSDSTAKFCKDEENNAYLYSRTTRWTQQHQAVMAWNPRKHPNSLMVMVITPLSENLKGTMGPVCIVYFDGSSLPDGIYSVKMLDSNVVWTDKHQVRSYLVPDTETTFKISNGEVKTK